jgi:hypothetical protein
MRKSHIYNISIENKSKLELVARISVTPGKAIAFVVAVVVLIFILATLLVLSTPLWKLRAGQLSDDQRRTSIDAVLMIDSLKIQAERNEAFMENLRMVLDPNRPTNDSTKYSGTPKNYSLDELKERSEVEKAFVAKMDEKERYNISVLAPLAAEDVEFYDIARSMVQTKASMDSQVAEIIVPTGYTINSPSEARVIDVYYSPVDGGNVIVLQQPKGFITRMSHLGTVLIKRGDNVDGGEAIAYSNAISSKHKGIISIEMWHNGSILIPQEYLFRNREVKQTDPDPQVNNK